MIRKATIAWLLFLYTLSGAAQQHYQFNQGLVSGPVHRYGREALVKDLLMFEFYTNNASKPAESSPVLKNNDTLRWEAIVADTAGTFRSNKLANGYLYLTYSSSGERAALLNISGSSMVFVNGEPRAGDLYRMGWLALPVKLRKGVNEIMIRCSSWARWQGVSASITFPEKPVALRMEDPTLPHVVLNDNNKPLWAAMVVVNATPESLHDLTITTRCEGRTLSDIVPVITPFTIRKVAMRIDAANVHAKGNYTCVVQLKQKGKRVDEKSVTLEAVRSDEHHSNTFISDIDGSVQYYGVAPPSGASTASPALFLSVHGAGVEAIGQARAYQKKDWGVLVAPTNRRPRGFNWEDWGMQDALEVLKIATEKFNPDPQRIYLTGHSMGGHGTWFLGATFPDQWAAIAPCAGYPSLMAYGSADGKIPEATSAMEKMLRRASNPSDIFALSKNYRSLGVYIHHGDSDRVVSVNYARQMRQVLSTFHPDFSYYEYPGGSHWFGNESVDWPPLFDYFKWHTIPRGDTVNNIDFTTANPAVSSRYHWVEILQQQHSLQYSRLQLTRNKEQRRISGKAENVSAMRIALKGFKPGETVNVHLDSLAPMRYTVQTMNDTLYLQKNERWKIARKPDPRHKGVHRGGTFKESFNHRMVFVYSTKGSKEENAWSYNKARYDAEVWYYRGNGAVDIVRDTDFDPGNFKDRGIILYGNASTNHAWKKLLSQCPVQVRRGSITVGDKQYRGENLGAYFMWPRKDSNVASVGVVSGSGLAGMNAAEANQYFAAGSGFPDFMIFTVDMLKDGAGGIKAAGFYSPDWRIENEESILEQ